MDEVSPLEAEVRRLIDLAGPMPIAEYMRLCLTHPRHGYYTTRDPLGAAGDFTTAPEISQMFGELIGLWAASVWRQMGEPDTLRLIELGPGRGTMMLDMLRAAKVVAGFRTAIVAHLVEISPALERRQRQTLNGLDVPLLWHKKFDEVPDGASIIVANEFFDALPVHQAIKQDDGWHERAVALDDEGGFAFEPSADALPCFAQTVPDSVRAAPIEAIFEWRNHQPMFDIARRVVRHGGAALIIDYGHTESECGDTFQAVAGHAFADPLVAPGEADLTAHVDFAALATAAESMGARALGPITQREFLLQVGIERRAAALKSKAKPGQEEMIESGLQRLIDDNPDGMGRMFKVLGIADPALDSLPGFEPGLAERE